jgi:hypothetical protein
MEEMHGEETRLCQARQRGATSGTWGGAAARSLRRHQRGEKGVAVLRRNRIGNVEKETCSGERACELG